MPNGFDRSVASTAQSPHRWRGAIRFSLFCSHAVHPPGVTRMREKLPISSVVDETCNRFKFTFTYALGEPKVTGLVKMPTGLPAAPRGRCQSAGACPRTAPWLPSRTRYRAEVPLISVQGMRVPRLKLSKRVFLAELGRPIGPTSGIKQRCNDYPDCASDPSLRFSPSQDTG